MSASSERKQPFLLVGSSFGRTGTYSLKIALDQLGLKCYHMVEVFQGGKKHLDFWIRVGEGKPYDWEEVMAGYQAAVDFPVAPYYKDILDKYPDAKVVHLERDFDSWYKSVRETIYNHSEMTSWTNWTLRLALPFFRRFHHMTHALIWDQVFQGRLEDKEFTRKVYEDYNRKVVETVPAPQLLVMKIQDGWAPLCKFLSVQVPDRPFPKENDTAAFQARTKKFRLVAYAIWTLPVVGVALFAKWWMGK